jgi:hypothetical protein
VELAHIQGVFRVDVESVPDHVLVDVVYGLVTPDDLLAAVRRSVLPALRCQAEVMKSCISAGPSRASR